MSTDNNTNSTDPKTLRTRYILIFFIFIIAVVLLWIYRPFGLFTNYTGATIFVSLLVFMFLITMILFYDYLAKNPNSSNIPKNLSANIFFISFSFLLSASFIVLLMWVFGFFSTSPSTTNIGSYIINFLLLFVMLSIIYKIFMMSNLNKTAIGRVILYSILYIPCIFVNIIEMIMHEYKQTTTTMVILFLIEICLVVLYFVYPIIVKKIYTQGGKQLINQPVPLDREYSIATYQQLNDSDEYNYNYALSFWFCIDSMPPNTNANYSKYTTILSYGNNPHVSYNPDTNSLLITVSGDSVIPISIVDLAHKLEDKMTYAGDEQIPKIQTTINDVIHKVKNVPIMNEHDENGKRIIYLKKDIQLQKWNNVILNYNGGTLDIFYNAELVKSAVEVVSYLTYDTLLVGENKGVSGGISNLTYFKSPLDIFKINALYNSMKDKTPPALPENERTIIPI